MLNKDIHKVDIHRCLSLALVFLAVILTLVLMVGVASGASISSPEWDRPSKQEVHEITESETRAARVASLAALQIKVQEQGSVRVIVGLNVAFQPEGDLASPQAVQDQQARINGAQDALLERLEPFAVKSVARFEYIPFIALEVDAEALADLGANPDVISLEEDIPVPPTLDSSIPVIGADDAWAAGYEGSGQVVAILDTGVESSHPFIGSRVVSEACYSHDNGFDQLTLCPDSTTEQIGSGSADPNTANCQDGPDNMCDHGTHVAGIAAGNGTSFDGVARSANIIAIQVFTRFNDESYCGGAAYTPCVLTYSTDQILGLERVYALRSSFNIAAANMSLGGGSYSSYCDAAQSARKAAIDNLRSVNIATVISSGNSGYRTSIGAPACISSAISVGSTTDSDVVSSFSNVASFLSLLAPGSSINSSIPGGGYAIFSGTSMSAPHVTGTWAVLKSKMPSASVDDILTALQTSGVTVDDTRSSGTVTGMKRIQVDAALNALSVTNWIYMPLVLKDFGGGPAPTPTPSGPTPGFWEGVYEEFYVTPDSAYVDNFAIFVNVPGCGNYKITHLPQEPISSNQFSFSGSFYASGTFDSVTEAHGTEGLNNFYIPGCGYVNGGPWSWTDTWQDSSQPTVFAELASPEMVEPIGERSEYRTVTIR
jgi:subtilisin